MKLSAMCVWVACVYMLAAGCALAGEVSEIELKDGNAIRAEIISLDKDFYTLRSDSLGTFRVDRSKVKSIRMNASDKKAVREATGETEGIQALTNDQIKALQTHMVSDEDVLNKIVALHDDPDFKSVLDDPEVMKAVNSGDLSALMANPKFMKLMNKPEVHDIHEKALK
jgi:hypothetical protein